MADEARSLSANKIARVTLSFWVMKICATTLGETGGDLMSMTLDIGYAWSSIILLSLFAVSLTAQLRAKTFHPLLYWTVIVATSTAGTTMSDFIDRTLHLGYATGCAVLVSILVTVLVVWRFSVGSISVNDVRTTRAEIFYWLAILASNTLGTALGDYLADTSGLGFAKSNLLITSGIVAIAVLYAVTPLSRTLLFWAAFVLTRPFGATMGDLLTKSHEQGGLGIGTAGSSLVLLGVLLAFLYGTSRRPVRSAAQS